MKVVLMGVIVLLGRGAPACTATFAGSVVEVWKDRPDKTPVRGLMVRACSLDRVIETTSDSAGRFRFNDLPPGLYDVMAGGRGWLPRVLNGIDVEAGQNQPIEIEMRSGAAPYGNAPSSMPVCFRYDAQDCKQTSFNVEYEEPSSQQHLGQIAGLIQVPRSRHGFKTVRGARVLLYQTGSTQVAASTVSDRRGEFKFAVEPGVYEIRTSRTGLLDAGAEAFLVPRENVTKVIVTTLRNGRLMLCVDEAMRQ